MTPSIHITFPISPFTRKCLLIPYWLNKHTDGIKSMYFLLNIFNNRTKYFVNLPAKTSHIWNRQRSSSSVFCLRFPLFCESNTQLRYELLCVRFRQKKQATIVAITRLTLDWLWSQNHLLLLAKFHFQNYRWTYTDIQRNCVLFQLTIIFYPSPSLFGAYLP
jgi:hypothetical protein